MMTRCAGRRNMMTHSSGTWRGRWRYLTLVALLCVACEKSPSEVYTEMSTSAMLGDVEGFLEGFTDESQTLVKALISLSEAYGFQKDNPYELLVFDAIEKEEINEAGDQAVLWVRTRKVRRKVLMVRQKEDDAWRIDVQALERYWKENKRSWK